VDISVDQQDLNRVIRQLKDIDDQSVRTLRTKLKVGLGPYAAKIQADIPKDPPLSGMRHRGRTKWRGVNKPVVSFYPGRSTKKGSVGERNLLVITVTGGKRGLGFDYAELAGIRSRPGATRSKPYQRRTRTGGISREMTHRVTSQGDIFIQKLQERKPIRGAAGRYAYDSFLKQKPAIVETARLIINNFMGEYNRKFRI
jgi:hypothetical protein